MNRNVALYRAPVDQGVTTQNPDMHRIFDPERPFIKNSSWFGGTTLDWL